MIDPQRAPRSRLTLRSFGMALSAGTIATGLALLATLPRQAVWYALLVCVGMLITNVAYTYRSSHARFESASILLSFALLALANVGSPRPLDLAFAGLSVLVLAVSTGVHRALGMGCTTTLLGLLIGHAVLTPSMDAAAMTSGPLSSLPSLALGGCLALLALSHAPRPQPAPPEQHRGEAHQKLLRELEAQSRRTTMVALGDAIAHEVNNPLTYVVTNLDVLRKRLQANTGISAEELTMLEDAVDGAARIADLVDDLRRLDDSDAGAHEAVPLADVVRDLEVLVHDYVSRRATYVTTVASDLLVVGPKAKLLEVLVALIHRAAEQMPVSDTRQHALTISASRAGQSVQIRLTTTGHAPAPVGGRNARLGIEDLERRTDLRWLFAKLVAERAGGSLRVTTSTTEGTTVLLTWPNGSPKRAARPGRRSEPEVEPSQSNAAKAPWSRSSTVRATALGSARRMLVVDAEPAIAVALQRSFTTHRVVGASTGAEGLARCQDEPFDLILCDVMLDDLDGAAFYRRLVELDPRLARRTVFTTTGSVPPAVAACLRSLPNRVLAKPLRTHLITEMLVDDRRFRSSAEQWGTG